MNLPTTGTVARAMRLMRALAEHEDGATVAQLASELALPRPTVHRLLNLLMAQGMAALRPDNRYEAGKEFLRLAALITNRRSLEYIAMPMMRQAVRACRETCWLAAYLPAQLAISFVAEVQSPHPLGYRMATNTVLPVLWGASGQSILAFRPGHEIDEILRTAEPSPATGNPPPSQATLEATLAIIRRRGYAYSEGERIADARGVAAPILDVGGHAVGSLVFTIPRIRFDPRNLPELGALIAEQAQLASEQLGYTPPTRTTLTASARASPSLRASPIKAEHSGREY